MRIYLVPGRFLSCLGPLLLLGAASVASASLSSGSMTPLAEDEMAGVTGAGLAFAMDNFSIRMAPTSFIELAGTAPTPQAVLAGWSRGEARYFGLSMTSGSTAGVDWLGNSCSGSLNCPLGLGDGSYGTPAFASVYNPFVLRVFQYPGYDYQGQMRDSTDPQSSRYMPTILEFIGPTRTDTWRWSFWGEIEVGRSAAAVHDDMIGVCNNSSASCSGGADFIQSQTLILGKPIASGNVWRGLNGAGADLGYQSGEALPAILRLMRTENANDPTLGITYQSALSGDFRFSVRQTSSSSDELMVVPEFNTNEGLHFRNVDAYLPLGNLHYQAITFGGISEYGEDASRLAAPVQNGNFYVELTRIPNISAIYEDFYCDGPCSMTNGYINNPNRETSGYVRWGNWYNPGTATSLNPYTATLGSGQFDLPNGSSTANGIYFVGGGTPGSGTPQSNVTNLGIARVEGMRIHHLKITTLGAGGY